MTRYCGRRPVEHAYDRNAMWHLDVMPYRGELIPRTAVEDTGNLREAAKMLRTARRSPIDWALKVNGRWKAARSNEHANELIAERHRCEARSAVWLWAKDGTYAPVSEHGQA